MCLEIEPKKLLEQPRSPLHLGSYQITHYWLETICPWAAYLLRSSSMSSQRQDFIGCRGLKSPLSFLPPPHQSENVKWTSSHWSLGAPQVRAGVFVPCTIWAWAQQRWRLQLSFSHFEGINAVMHLMGMWQVFIFCSCKLCAFEMDWRL